MLKSEVNPTDNLHLPQMSIIFLARSEIFSRDYMGYFSLVNGAEHLTSVAQTGLKIM